MLCAKEMWAIAIIKAVMRIVRFIVVDFIDIKIVADMICFMCSANIYQGGGNIPNNCLKMIMIYSFRDLSLDDQAVISRKNSVGKSGCEFFITWQLVRKVGEP